jgi:hypothetical protein
MTLGPIYLSPPLASNPILVEAHLITPTNIPPSLLHDVPKDTRSIKLCGSADESHV